MSPTSIWIQKLRRLEPLGDSETAAITALPIEVLKVAQHTVVIREKHPFARFGLVLSGYVNSHKTSQSGVRQILTVHVPGDSLGIEFSASARCDYSVQALTEASIGWIDYRKIADLTSRFPQIALAFGKERLIDAAIVRQRLLSIGRSAASERIAHFMCEFIIRRFHGMGSNKTDMSIPFSQRQLADVTGQTTVHLNRMLNVLSERGLLIKYRNQYRVRDFAELMHFAGFDPDYLYELGTSFELKQRYEANGLEGTHPVARLD